jgi:hypothetical protein
MQGFDGGLCGYFSISYAPFMKSFQSIVVIFLFTTSRNSAETSKDLNSFEKLVTVTTMNLVAREYC